MHIHIKESFCFNENFPGDKNISNFNSLGKSKWRHLLNEWISLWRMGCCRAAESKEGTFLGYRSPFQLDISCQQSLFLPAVLLISSGG